jgi:hypothetical protein
LYNIAIENDIKLVDATLISEYQETMYASLHNEILEQTNDHQTAATQLDVLDEQMPIFIERVEQEVVVETDLYAVASDFIEALPFQDENTNDSLLQFAFQTWVSDTNIQCNNSQCFDIFFDPIVNQASIYEFNADNTLLISPLINDDQLTITDPVECDGFTFTILTKLANIDYDQLSFDLSLLPQLIDVEHRLDEQYATTFTFNLKLSPDAVKNQIHQAFTDQFLDETQNPKD